VEVTGDVRREEPHNFHCFPNSVEMIKPINMDWMVHVACMGELKNTCEALLGKPERRR
jgi:hypothetical protein